MTFALGGGGEGESLKSNKVNLLSAEAAENNTALLYLNSLSPPPQKSERPPTDALVLPCPTRRMRSASTSTMHSR